ncbi:MAG TPA: SIMPL domain-containing protein [Candidatus Scatosoma pullistercoris]|uniref:SIMPL domain-containing protein n=1 Tax=Candidatus Scatosoma pullistercoris TaxID=2840934 RepID=A0A9D1SGF6_9FIRM|nr:SIMPL domain-containing protein [Candidatus Scatosoma pullistercoris]
MERELKICGKGKIRLRPDTVCAEVVLQGVEKEYAGALEKSETALGKVKRALLGAGFGEETMKTSDFRVNTRYENVRDEKGDWRQQFAGYEYRHVLTVRFSAESARLGAFAGAVAGCGADPLFSFSYTVRDSSAAREWLLREAVKDCAKKALILADAACVKLGEIVRIDYSSEEGIFSSRPIQPMRLNAAADRTAPVSFDVAPEDIEVEDKVTVVWSIG